MLLLTILLVQIIYLNSYLQTFPYLKRLRNNIREIKNESYTYPSDYPLVKYDYAFMLEKGETKFPNITLNVIPDINYSDHLPMVIQISKDTLKLR